MPSLTPGLFMVQFLDATELDTNNIGSNNYYVVDVVHSDVGLFGCRVVRIRTCLPFWCRQFFGRVPSPVR